MKIGTTQNLLDHVKDTTGYILGHLLAFENALKWMMNHEIKSLEDQIKL